ncbi:MAG: nuclear transport factor 2 family protein [Gammaproteobacteria bacterium]|nr:nuclear transport factor 2 family protein [Gammaproteobacteria bacterium]
MHALVNDFCQYYEKLDQNPLSQLGEIYSDDIEFCDPVHCVHGIETFTRYFEEMMQQVQRCWFDIEQVIEQDNEAYVRWVMNFQHPRLNGGNLIEVPGVSHLRFGEKIDYHCDYYDLGAMLYEHIPLLGSLVKGIKKRLK